MVGKNSPEYASGQIIFGLKMSRLNYIVKETPYSVYITVRKKFIKDDHEDQSASVEIIPPYNSDTEVELKRLKEKNVDLETRLELAKVEFEEMEIAKEAMKNQLSNQDDQIDGLLGNVKIFEKQVDVLTKDNDDFKSTIDQNLIDIEEFEERNVAAESDKSELNDKIEVLCKELFDLRQNSSHEQNVFKIANNKTKDLERKLSKTHDDLKEATENILILEYTLGNTKLEVESLMEKFCEKCDYKTKTGNNLESHIPEPTDESTPSTSNCGICEYKSDDESEMELHKYAKHINPDDLKCQNCNLVFKSQKKLNDHMCRIPVLNPSCGDSYIKNWVIFDGCSRIFSKSLETEIVFLHSQNCINNIKSCPDLLPDYEIDMVNYDGEIWHAPLSEFFS